MSCVFGDEGSLLEERESEFDDGEVLYEVSNVANRLYLLAEFIFEQAIGTDGWL